MSRIDLEENNRGSNLGFLVLESKTLVAALAAASGTQRISCIALHAHPHIE